MKIKPKILVLYLMNVDAIGLESKNYQFFGLGLFALDISSCFYVLTLTYRNTSHLLQDIMKSLVSYETIPS